MMRKITLKLKRTPKLNRVNRAEAKMNEPNYPKTKRAGPRTIQSKPNESKTK